MFDTFAPQTHLTRVHFDRVVNRDLHVIGVPRHELPREGFTVHYEPSHDPAENPLIRRHGSQLEISGPDVYDRIVHRRRERPGSGFLCCSPVTIDSHEIYISRPPRLPAIHVRVPNDVHEAKAQQCRNLDIRNLHDVRLDISAAGTTMGRNLGNVALRASGASRVQLEQVQSLNAYLSGASGVVAHSIGAGTHVSAQGASSADIRSAQGRLTGDARGASRIRAQGAFPAIELQASGASNIEIANALAVRPHARASGASLVRVNGRNVAGGYLRGPPYNRKSSCLLIGVSHDTP